MNKFIYVFNKEARDTLKKNNFNLLKNDEHNNVYIFENSASIQNSECFSLTDISFVYSDTLSF